MKECKNSDILPCYWDGYGVWHHSDDTHDKVYELNKQMCDIGKTMSDAKWEMDDIVRRAEENIRLHNDNNKYARLGRAAYERKFGKPKKKDIMEEKKTKKMTKVEAFEYLKGKKVYANGKGKEVQTKLFECGVGWATNHFVYYDFGDYLLIETDGRLYHCGHEGDSYWRLHHFGEISVDDILSIEIVEERAKDGDGENDANKISLLGSQICEILRQMNGHYHVEITEDSVNLYPEGTNLYYSEPC